MFKYKLEHNQLKLEKLHPLNPSNVEYTVKNCFRVQPIIQVIYYCFIHLLSSDNIFMNIYMIYYIHDETMFGMNWLHHDCSAPEETNDGEIQDTRDELMELTLVTPYPWCHNKQQQSYPTTVNPRSRIQPPGL